MPHSRPISPRYAHPAGDRGLLRGLGDDRDQESRLLAIRPVDRIRDRVDAEQEAGPREHVSRGSRQRRAGRPVAPSGPSCARTGALTLRPLGRRAAVDLQGPYARGVRRAVRALGLLTALALVGGCGSGYSKADFVASADAICASAVRETRSIPPPSVSGGGPQTLHALAGYLGHVLPIVQSEARKLRALPHPAGRPRERAELTRYLAAVARTARGFETLATAAKRGDAPDVAGAEAELRANPVAALAARYGLRSCGTPGATVG
jgi:hypothetical protein